MTLAMKVPDAEVLVVAAVAVVAVLVALAVAVDLYVKPVFCTYVAV